MLELSRFQWQRDTNNPIFPLGSDGAYDAISCMNPNILRVGDEYRLYYSGGDADGHQRICLATSSLKFPTRFTRHGVVLGLGTAGAFDAHWCVLPFVLRIRNKWHLYYSGHDGTNAGLQSFWGIGLATSDDGVHFERYDTEPIVTGNLTKEFPHNRGIAGGSVVEDTLEDGVIAYRMYYTLSVGVPNDDIAVAQEKHCAVCHSRDGIHWTDHRLILSPRKESPNEDIAVATPFVWRVNGGYRMLYSGIGTRWGSYGISEATSIDGYHWFRGEPLANLSLEFSPSAAWESGMVEYPAIIRGDGHYRLFYCGTGYGKSGIGTAIAPLE